MRIILTNILLFLSIVAYSQTGGYFTVGGNYGKSNLLYQFDNSDSLGYTSTSPVADIGMGGKVMYSYFLTRNFGVSIGFGKSEYNVKSSITGYHRRLTGVQFDLDGDEYFREIMLRNIDDNVGWEEKQQVKFNEIPILLNLQFYLKGNFKLYISGGLKFQMPTSSTYSVVPGSLVDKQGYYGEWNVVLSGIPEAGFTTLEEYTSSDEFTLSSANDIGKSIIATGNAGFIFNLSPRIEMYLGVVIDNGLDDIKARGTTKGYPALISESEEIETFGDIVYAGFLNSNITSDVSIFSIKGEAGFRFKLSGDKDSKEDEDKKKEEEVLEEKKKEDSTKEEEEKKKEEEKKRLEEEERKMKEDEEKRLEEEKTKLEEVVAVSTKDKTTTLFEEKEKPKATPVRNLGIDENLRYTKSLEKYLDPDDASKMKGIVFGYDLNSSYVGKAQMEYLMGMIPLLEENPNVKIEIVGHTCSIGSYIYNYSVGLARAKRIKDLFETAGVDSNRIIVKSEGERNPKYSNMYREGRLKNRRVVIRTFVDDGLGDDIQDDGLGDEELDDLLEE